MVTSLTDCYHEWWQLFGILKHYITVDSLMGTCAHSCYRAVLWDTISLMVTCKQRRKRIYWSCNPNLLSEVKSINMQRAGGKLEFLVQVITQSIITETCQACPNTSCIKILLWLVAAQIQNRRSVMQRIICRKLTLSVWKAYRNLYN